MHKNLKRTYLHDSKHLKCATQSRAEQKHFERVQVSKELQTHPFHYKQQCHIPSFVALMEQRMFNVHYQLCSVTFTDSMYRQCNTTCIACTNTSLPELNTFYFHFRHKALFQVGV